MVVVAAFVMLVVSSVIVARPELSADHCKINRIATPLRLDSRRRFPTSRDYGVRSQPTNSMQRRLEGKVALVTGGGSGFGYGISQKFAEEGAKVLVLDINEGKVGELKSLGVEFCRGDVSLRRDWENALDVVLDKWCKLDIVVNCAGILIVKVQVSPTYATLIGSGRLSLRTRNTNDFFKSMLKVYFRAPKSSFPTFKNEVKEEYLSTSPVVEIPAHDPGAHGTAQQKPPCQTFQPPSLFGLIPGNQGAGGRMGTRKYPIQLNCPFHGGNRNVPDEFRHLRVAGHSGGKGKVGCGGSLEEALQD